MQQLTDLLKSFYGIAASVGVLLPGYTFFTNNAPPLFSGITLITSALSVAIFVMHAKGKQRFSKKVNTKGFSFLIISFILLLAYLFLLDYSTVTIDDSTRWQAGFGTQTWSLTAEGVNMVTKNICPGNSASSLLLCAGFDKDHITLIWKQWTVYVSGLMLIICFTASALLWTKGWVDLGRNYLAKTKSDPKTSTE